MFQGLSGLKHKKKAREGLQELCTSTCGDYPTGEQPVDPRPVSHWTALRSRGERNSSGRLPRGRGKGSYRVSNRSVCLVRFCLNLLHVFTHMSMAENLDRAESMPARSVPMERTSHPLNFQASLLQVE